MFARRFWSMTFMYKTAKEENGFQSPASPSSRYIDFMSIEIFSAMLNDPFYPPLPEHHKGHSVTFAPLLFLHLMSQIINF